MTHAHESDGIRTTLNHLANLPMRPLLPYLLSTASLLLAATPPAQSPAAPAARTIPSDLEALATRVDQAHRPDGPDGPVEPVTSFRATLEVHLQDPNSKEAGQVDLDVKYLQRPVPKRKRIEHLIHCRVKRAGKPVERGYDRFGYWKLYQGKARDIPESDQRDREDCQRDKHLARQLVKFLDPGAVLRALQDPTPVGAENLKRGREKPVPCQTVEGTLPAFPLLRLGGGDATVRAKVYVTKGEGRLHAVLVRPIRDGRVDEAAAEMIRLREPVPKAGMLVPKIVEHFYRDQEQRLVKMSTVYVSKLDLRPEFTLQSLERPKSE
jgi:hypothetical protein